MPAATDDLAELQRRYQESGLAARVGWGDNPALVIVDLIDGFTDSTCPLGSALDDVVKAAAELMVAARSARAPVVLSKVVYRPDMSDAGIWPDKIPSQHLLVEGSHWVEFDARLPVDDDDIIIEKKHASAFFGTNLAEVLRARDVDGVIVAGATTSGCVRATVVDASAAGFRPTVVSDAVGDRHRLVHEVSLFDMDAKYADVVPLADALRFLRDRSTR